MGLNWAEHSVEIEAPIETCFEAITDYESFPSWQSAVVSTEVVDREKSGLGRRVKLVVDAKVRKVDYTLDYRYEKPERIEWDFVEGNGINDADGHYLFEELGEGLTRATYKFGLEVGIPLPGPVARRAHRQTLKGSVEDLKREAERRATASEGAKASSPKGLAGFGRRRPPTERERPAAPEEPTVERPTEAERPIRSGLGDWIPRDPASAARLPAEVAGRGLSLGRRVAGRTVRTGRDVTLGAAEAGVDAARSAIDAGLGMARSARDRASRLLGR
jgi:uncharacterized membrane protein